MLFSKGLFNILRKRVFIWSKNLSHSMTFHRSINVNEIICSKNSNIRYAEMVEGENLNKRRFCGNLSFGIKDNMERLVCCDLLTDLGGYWSC